MLLFPAVSMHSIKSSNQRALAEHWNALAIDRRFPTFAEFNPQRRDHTPEQLILWDVERADDGGSHRFRMRQLGLRAAEALDASMVGKTMDELVPPTLREVSLEGARECALSGCAIYAVITTIMNGHQVDCERLLLPFGSNDGVVDQIVASLQLISFQGVVEREAIVRDFETRANVSLSGKIASAAAARRPMPTVAASEVPLAPNSPQPDAAETAPGKAAPGDGRTSVRRKVVKTGRISFGKSSEVCTVRDMSATGALIDLDNSSIVPNSFTLVLEMESAQRKCSVTWRKDRQIGVQFG